ncbi:leucine-rich repeat-containing protein 34 isoform X3 [Cervus elaphus]|uniref:leucine-rich repeat-containing protein 34 isoform X3 n=1 Tax=Cervus canadensis TaxID=1574408 RepID=UPI001C9E5266|nr:leucine-rich repeat-containing protein 34 isoform X3 [Cervus canadensis]XP_043731003.1 leucine-rich repeat-containing protein 34 isoform X3 [Cervus elaphus]
MELSQKQAGPASGSPLPAPSRTPTQAWAAADDSVAASTGGLQEYYYDLCMEKSQEIKPFILQILQEVDEEIEKGSVGITLNIAGNSRSLSGERVTGEDFWILCRVLKNNSYINGLDVRYNLLSDVGAYYAAKLLQKNRTLKHLRMTGNKIENKGGMFFAAMLQINSSLEKLDLGDCDLGMQSVIAFATVLTQNQTIKGLNLNRPILYGEQEESTVHLSHMLKENQCLIELHMCKHDIKNCGMKQLCDALYLNRSLQYLDVSCNKITQDGMKCLADVLKSNTTLEVIDLSFNRMENAGANYLSDALASHNRTLKALSVVSNNIEGKGLVALSQSMKTNPTLSHIYIWGNKFDEATCVAYSDLIHTGRLKSDNTDVEPFVVDGHVYLAEVSNGLKRHYYWTPGYGEACSPSSNAGFSLAPVGQHL